ncbi:MAG: DUF4116 domain-containing protein [Candidatus Saganbacteria bacterium]|nr:DUF4116 domain-containing protein [Candidatus Saganbacteria bacterium]
MEILTLSGTRTIEDIYRRLREIDSIKDGKADGIITREELGEASNKNINTVIQFNEGKTSSYDAIQKLYLKLQAMDKKDGSLDGNIEELKSRSGITLTTEQIADVSILLETDDFVSAKKRRSIISAIKRGFQHLQYTEPSARKDKKVVLAAVEKDGMALQYAGESLRKDKDVVLAALEQNSEAMQYMDKTLWKDKEIVLAAAGQNGSALEHAHSDLKMDKEFVLAIVNKNGGALQYADESLKKDKEIVLAAVKQSGKILQYADEGFRKNKEIVLAAVKQNGEALQYADRSLRRDKEVVLAAVKQNGNALVYADYLTKDKEVVLAAVEQNGDAVIYGDIVLRRGKDFEKVISAVIEKNKGTSDFAKKRELALDKVKGFWRNLEEMDAPFKKDKEIVLAAVKEYWGALQYADETLRNDKEVVLAAVKQNGAALEYADNTLKKDKKIVLIAVEQDGKYLQHADESLKKDKEVVLAAVEQNGFALQYADKSLRKDKEVVLAAIDEIGLAIEYADETLKKDKEVVLAAVKESGGVLQYADESLKRDKVFVLTVVKKAGSELQYADETLRKDKEVVLAAVKQNGGALQYADRSFRKDKEVVLVAVKTNKYALQYADDSLRYDREVVLATVPSLDDIYNSNTGQNDYLSLFVSNILLMGFYEESDASLKALAHSGKGMLSSYRTINQQIEKTGLKGLSNIDPDSANKLISIIVEIYGYHDLWATRSKYSVMRDIRLIEMSNISVIAKILSQEGKMETPKITTYKFDWSGRPSIPVNLPSNVYWYKKDIPELRSLLNSKYEVYKKAAAKALEKIAKDGVEDQELEAGNKPSPEKAQALRKMMEDKDWTLRYRALEALRISGADAAELTPEILKLFNDKDWYVHNSAALIIEKNKEKHIEYLKDSIKTGSEFAQERAKDILGPTNPK